ncbi:MAG: RidA family protein [Chromatocurvus sp.]
MNGQKTALAQQIATDPDPMAPYHIAQAYRVGDLLITSGQAAINERGEVIGIGDFDAQAQQVFHNLTQVLEAGGSSLAQVIKVTIYLTDMRHFPRIVELRRQHFTPPYPADTIVEVRALALPELEIEIEATALVAGTLVAAASG